MCAQSVTFRPEARRGLLGGASGKLLQILNYVLKVYFFRPEACGGFREAVIKKTMYVVDRIERFLQKPCVLRDGF